MKAERRVEVVGFGSIILRSYSCEDVTHSHIVELLEDDGDGAPTALSTLYDTEVEEMIDALSELIELKPAAEPKITYKVVEQQIVDRYGSYVKKPTVCRVEPTTREITVATFEVQKDADDFAELMNSK